MNPFTQSTVALPTGQSFQATSGAVSPGYWRRVGAAAAGLAIGAAAASFSATAYAVNVNAADAQQLMQISGIGAKTAQRIVAERERAGPFESLDDLSDRVKGIGTKTVRRFEAAGLTAGGQSPPSAPAPAPAAAVPPQAGKSVPTPAPASRLSGFFMR